MLVSEEATNNIRQSQGLLERKRRRGKQIRPIRNRRRWPWRWRQRRRRQEAEGKEKAEEFFKIKSKNFYSDAKQGLASYLFFSLVSNWAWIGKFFLISPLLFLQYQKYKLCLRFVKKSTTTAGWISWDAELHLWLLPCLALHIQLLLSLISSTFYCSPPPMIALLHLLEFPSTSDLISSQPLLPRTSHWWLIAAPWQREHLSGFMVGGLSCSQTKPSGPNKPQAGSVLACVSGCVQQGKYDRLTVHPSLAPVTVPNRNRANQNIFGSHGVWPQKLECVRPLQRQWKVVCFAV